MKPRQDAYEMKIVRHIFHTIEQWFSSFFCLREPKGDCYNMNDDAMGRW